MPMYKSFRYLYIMRTMFSRAIDGQSQFEFPDRRTWGPFGDSKCKILLVVVKPRFFEQHECDL